MNFNNKTDGLLNFSDYKKLRNKILYWIMFLLLVLICLACIVPVAWVIISSVKPTAELYRVPPTLFPHSVDFSIIKNAWSKVNFGKYYLNSALLIFGAIFCEVVINGLCGYALAKIKPLGTKLIMNLLFWTMLMPGISMVPLYETFISLGLMNSFVPLWLMAGCNAFHVMLFRNFFNGIPTSYVEAARIDGMSELGIFSKIIVPLSKPIIIVVCIFTFTKEWSSFMWPYLILTEDQATVAVKLYLLHSNPTIMDNEMMSILLFSIIPPALIYVFFSKHITGGVSMDGIKG